MASDELNGGSLAQAQRYLALAIESATSVPANRRGSHEVLVAILRLFLARQRSDRPAVVEEARRLLGTGEHPDTSAPGLGEDLRALADAERRPPQPPRRPAGPSPRARCP